MRERMDKLRRDGDWRVSFGRPAQRIGDDRRMSGNRTEASIDLEAPMRQALRADELEKAGIDGLEPWVMQAYEQGGTLLRDNHVVAAMLQKGKLMSRGEALRSGKIVSDGKETGDYNGMPWLPRAWFAGGKAGYMPDVMAQELFDDGLLKEPTPDALWDALRSALDQHAKDNKAFHKARAAVTKVRKTARNQAREETYEWARAEKAKIPTPYQRQMMALRTLDALLAVVPPEVRGKVGGYVKLASLKSDAAREKEIESRLGKLADAMETFAQKHYLGQIAKDFDRYRPQKDDRGRITSKLTADVAEDVGFAYDFAAMDDANQEKEMAALEKVLNDSEDAAEIQDAIGRLAIAQLFHKLEDRDSAEVEAAAKWLRDTVSGARQTRKIMDEARAAWVKEAKTAAKADSANGKLSDLPDAENVEADVRSSTFKKFTAEVKGFFNSVLFTLGQQLEIIFGQDSRITREFHQRAVKAANFSTDIKRAIEERRCC